MRVRSLTNNVEVTEIKFVEPYCQTSLGNAMDMPGPNGFIEVCSLQSKLLVQEVVVEKSTTLCKSNLERLTIISSS